MSLFQSLEVFTKKERDPKKENRMDRLLRLSGAGLGGMGGAQQPADAPVVDTAEQVWTVSLDFWLNLNLSRSTSHPWLC